MKFKSLFLLATAFMLTCINDMMAQCQASFTWTANGSTVTFNGVSGGMSPNSTFYSWTFGDGSSGFGMNTTHTYNSSGLYSVCLVASDSNCTYTYCDSIFVPANNPCSNFTASAWAYADTSANVNGLVYFGANSSGGTGPYTYNWDYGDGNTGSGSSPTHTYANPYQFYQYCVTVTDANGCTASYCDSVDANNPCADSTLYASFSYQDNNGVVSFYSSTGQTPSSYYWSFGDNSSSTQANPVHQYANSGTYNVWLVVNFPNGCSRMYAQTITVGNSNPCANFSAAYTYTNNAGVVSFSSTVNGGTAPYSYSWNFGDGGTSTQANPTHTYTNTNTYYGAYLVVSDANGCVYTAYDTVSFGGGANPCTLNEMTLVLNFDNYAYETSWDLRNSQGAIVASGSGYTPNQNGTSLTQTFCLPTDCYVFNIYDSYGDGICCLYGQGDYTLTDATGNILASGGAFGYSETQTVCLGGATNPCSNFSTFFSSTTNGNVVTFNTQGQNGIQYVWDFGDNTSGSGANPVHTYNSAPVSGYYTVCVTAYDNLGCVATYCDSVAVNPVPCNNNQVTLALNFDNFAYETSWTLTDANNTVVYSGNGYTSANNGTTQYFNFCLPTGCYDFNIFDSYGDGICCGWGQGSYNLIDASGNVLASGGNFGQSESTNFCVGGASNPCGNINSSFVYNSTPNGQVYFNAVVSGTAGGNSYAWSFGNGTSSTQMNPTVTFTNNGSYNVCLTVTDSFNCSATYCQNVIITTLNNQNPCNGLSVDMNITQDTTNPFVLWMQPVVTNAAPNSYFYYIWDFGDNTGSFNGSPAHQYTNYGSYVVCLTAFDSVNNCIASFCDTITIDSAGNFSRNINYKDVKPGFLVNTLPPVINYYTSTSAIASEHFEMKVFPNPASETISVQFTTEESVEGQFSILNIAGQSISKIQHNCNDINCLQSFDISQFPSGVYFIRWTSGNQQITQKFIKE